VIEITLILLGIARRRVVHLLVRGKGNRRRQFEVVADREINRLVELHCARTTFACHHSGSEKDFLQSTDSVLAHDLCFVAFVIFLVVSVSPNLRLRFVAPTGHASGSAGGEVKLNA
jgi:hypothetical protein